jgi:hypothetical protein
MIINEIPITRDPINTYCLLLPHTDLVLSDTKPIIGSKKASTILGAKNKIPHIQAGNFKSSTKTTIKMPRAAGNIWLASIPNPNAIFWIIGTVLIEEAFDVDILMAV